MALASGLEHGLPHTLKWKTGCKYVTNCCPPPPHPTPIWTQQQQIQTPPPTTDIAHLHLNTHRYPYQTHTHTNQHAHAQYTCQLMSPTAHASPCAHTDTDNCAHKMCITFIHNTNLQPLLSNSHRHSDHVDRQVTFPLFTEGAIWQLAPLVGHEVWPLGEGQIIKVKGLHWPHLLQTKQNHTQVKAQYIQRPYTETQKWHSSWFPQLFSSFGVFTLIYTSWLTADWALAHFAPDRPLLFLTAWPQTTQ